MFMLVILVTQPAEDLGDTSRVGAAEAHLVDSTIESSLGKEAGGDKYYVFVEVIELWEIKLFMNGRIVAYQECHGYCI